MNRIIRIEANSNIFSFNSEVPEKKAEKVLRWILNSYKQLSEKHRRKIEPGKLKVTTSVVNPELFS